MTRCAQNDVLSERTGRRPRPPREAADVGRVAVGVERSGWSGDVFGAGRPAERVRGTGYGLAVPAVGQGTPCSGLGSDSGFGVEPSGRRKGSGEGTEGEGSSEHGPQRLWLEVRGDDGGSGRAGG